MNVEDDLWTSGRLSKLARTLRIPEDTALGRLVNVYRLTQRARVVTERPERLVTVIVLGFDTDADADAFLTAMITAQLATVLEDGRVTIKGNEARIGELDDWYRQKVEAGRRGGLAKARNRKSSTDSVATASESVANTKRNVPVFSPMSSVFSLTTEENTNTGSSHSAEPNEPVGKRKRSAAEQARARMVKQAFLDGHLEFYSEPLKRWGAPESAHVYHLLKSDTAENLAAKALAYHRWPHPDVIRAGHPFMNHRWSFSATQSEIEADMAKPERRRAAAQVNARMKTADDIAVDNDGVNRINALLAQRDEDERRLREQAERVLGPATADHPNAIGQGDPKAVHDAQPPAERRGGVGVLHAPGAVRERQADLGSAGGGAER